MLQNDDTAARERMLDYIFDAPFLRHVGIALVAHGAGTCEAALTVAPQHLQQDGFIHAGVQATLADHTAGAAAATLIAPGMRVLSAEFKVNLLRPARGERLVARARVLKPGRRLIVVASDVFAVRDGVEFHTATALVTLTPIEADGA